MIAFFIVLPLLLSCVLVIFYLERKIASFIQDRLGPMEVGKFGVLQAIADLLKLIQKEDIVPTTADKFFFKIAPIMVFLAVFGGFSVIPFCVWGPAAGIETGLYFLLAIVSLDVIGLLMAGWASNNKYALLGAMRSVAQIISYEIPIGLSVLSVVCISQTLDLQQITLQQSNFGLLSWNVCKAPHLIVSWIIFFIATLAECNRAPFDIPEAESELVAGFHVEYSGFRFAIFFLAEYAMMFLVSLFGVILFFGGWNSPFSSKVINPQNASLVMVLWSGFWLIFKTFICMIIQIWIRWTFPRLRIDQLMTLGWKFLTPFALAMVLISCLWKIFVLGI